MKLFDNLLLNEEEVLNRIKNSLETHHPLLITYFNVHCYNIRKKNETYSALIEDDFTTYPDGTGIWLLLKKLGKNYNRFNATDLNFKIVEMLKKNSSKVFFIGADIPLSLVEKKIQSVGINFCGYQNGFENEEVSIRKIISHNPDIVMVGMGVPKQEYFAHKLSKSLNRAVIVCVGNFFEFFFDTQKRAPKILRDIGLEWLYRFYLEPIRLFKRYTVGNFLFLVDLIRAKNK